MKIITLLSILFIGTLANSAKASPIFLCQSEDNLVQLEMRPLEKTNSSNYTVENIVRRPQIPDTYFRAYPLSIGPGLVYKSNIEPGFDGPEKDDGPIEGFRLTFPNGSGITQKQTIKGKLVIRQYKYAKKFFCDKYESPAIPRDENDEFVKKHKCKRWDLVRQPLKTETKTIKCQVLGKNDYENFCTGKSTDEIQMLLFSASQKKQPDLVEQALGCEADINATDTYGCTPLMMSVADNFATCAATTELEPDSWRSVKSRHLFNSLAYNGAYMDTQESTTGEAAIHKAVRSGREDIVKDMVLLEADLNIQNSNGTTALMIAAANRDSNLIRVLVGSDAKLGLKDNQGKTAYDRGEKLPSNIRELLLEPKLILTIEGRDDGGCTPLSFDVPTGQFIKLNLKATSGKMFLLSIPQIGISIMADSGKTVSKIIRFDKAGTFAHKCGVHGGRENNGKIIVK